MSKPVENEASQDYAARPQDFVDRKARPERVRLTIDSLGHYRCPCRGVVLVDSQGKRVCALCERFYLVGVRR